MSLATRRHGIACLALLTLAACSGDDTTDPGTTDLSGNYTLVSFQQGALGPFTPTTQPAATGSLVMTATTYNITVSIGGQVAIVDNGTYTVSGNSITQTSAVQPVQSVGTWTKSGNQYTIDVTAVGQRVISTWQKQ